MILFLLVQGAKEAEVKRLSFSGAIPDTSLQKDDEEEKDDDKPEQTAEGL